jgi:hypothetical protein
VDVGFTYLGGGGGCSQTVTNNTTDDGCTGAQWVADNFTAGATYSVPAYSLTYHAPNQGLIGHTWTDAGTGDSGDIYSSTS